MMRLVLSTSLFLLAQAATSVGQEAAPAAPSELAPAPREDWGRWERLTTAALSPDGKWAAWEIRRNDGTALLALRQIGSEETRTFEEGRGARFSEDSKWLAFSVGVSESEREKLEEKKKPVRNDLGLLELASGELVEVEEVSSFSFSEDGDFLAMRRYAQKGDENGADLVLRELALGRDTHFGRVGEMAWSEKGALLAMTVDAPEKAGNGVRVYDARSKMLRTLDSSDSTYRRLAWREDAADLAVLREKEFEEDEDTTHAVLAWRDLDGFRVDEKILDPLVHPGFPASLRVVQHAGLRWSDDGKAVFFGLKAWEERPAELDEEAEEEPEEEADEEEGEEADAEEADAEEEGAGAAKEEAAKEEKPRRTLRDSLDDPPGVEVWHVKDIDIIPRQKKQLGRDENENELAAFWLDEGRLVRVAGEDLEQVSLLEGQAWALGRDETPYEEEQRFSATMVDLHVVNTRDGARRKILERVRWSFTGDPKGTRFLFVRDDQIWVYDLEANTEVDLTGEEETHFINQENSSLTTEKPPYGVVGWTADGRHVLLNSRYDIWAFALDGSERRRLTDGAGERIRHRRVVLDADEEEFVDLASGFHVSVYGDTTKKSGYGHFRASAPFDLRVWKDARVSRLMRAKHADTYAFVQERVDDSPDLFVGDARFAEARQLSETNAFASEYQWSRSELVDYENAHGQPLQGALYYPAGWEAGKRYPMVVYIYELRSQNLHQYQAPSERSAYSTGAFTSRGYFVFQPDIVYRPQNPGLSAVECVVPAVEKVLESGKIDAERVGLMGHSWGAYQTAFLVTQTDLFAAGVAGAPLTNMMSMSMSIYWNSGQTDAWIFHEITRPHGSPVLAGCGHVHQELARSSTSSNMNTPLMIDLRRRMTARLTGNQGDRDVQRRAPRAASAGHAGLSG